MTLETLLACTNEIAFIGITDISKDKLTDNGYVSVCKRTYAKQIGDWYISYRQKNGNYEFMAMAKLGDLK
jgi:hypothetical protein